MAPPNKTNKGKQRLLSSPSSSSSSSSSSPKSPPHPFKLAPVALEPFTSTLSPRHVYITHIDSRPASFKRRIFLVPVAMNLVIVALFVLRARHILPWYWALLASALGRANETTVDVAGSSYGSLAAVVGRRALTFMLDFVLAVFVWPWPYEFVTGAGADGRGSPVRWRWNVGFRDREVYVRRSRESWDKELEGKDVCDAVGKDGRDARDTLLAKVTAATAPMMLAQKTGYLTMDGEWDLDWTGMVTATRLADKKEIALEAFGTVVLVHHDRFGWLTVDLGLGGNAEQEERRRQVMMFRDALTALGKEDLFFRWVEMIQFETTQPGGFTREKQVAAAQKIRDLFKENGVDFDQLWKETVGTDGLAGMP
ncbi:hypothetical protein VTK26DRAFT_5364 [Humicola hyalothermophila]